MFCAVMMWVLLGVYAKQNFGIPENLYGWIATTNAMMVILFQIPMTSVSKRYPNHTVLVVGAVLYVLAVTSIAFGRGFWWFWGSMVVMTVGELLLMPTSSAFVANLAPPEKRGRYMGIYGFTWGAAAGMAPLLGGFLNDTFGPRTIWLGGGLVGFIGLVGFVLLSLKKISQGGLMPEILMVFSPHPDDAEYYAGGTIARMIQGGAKAILVIVTDGRVGSFEQDSDSLAQTRLEEAKRAAKVMGAEPPIFLGHPDMGLDRLPPGLLREQFIRLIRQYRPAIVIAEDPFMGFEVHPDHRAVAWAASDAVNYSRLPLMHPEHLAEGLQPHNVREKYFYTDQSEGSTVIDITQTMEIKLAALAEHKSQMKFLVEGVLLEARQAGIDPSAIAGDALKDPATAVAWAMQAQAAQVGQKANVQFGEAFRYTRFHPFIEGLIKP
jgi:LmbE family N-acetylglucosaminyl deacetylase